MASGSDRSAVEQAVKGGVEAAMDTSLRDPILEAVEEERAARPSRLGRIRQIAIIAAVLGLITAIVRRVRRRG